MELEKELRMYKEQTAVVAKDEKILLPLYIAHKTLPRFADTQDNKGNHRRQTR